MTDLFAAGDIITASKLNQICEKGLSYIVRYNGSTYEAIDGSTGVLTYGGASNTGSVSGADALAVVHAAHGAAALNSEVLVTCALSLTSPILLTRCVHMTFDGNITTSSCNAMEIGDATHNITFARIKLKRIDGVDNSAHGIVVNNANANEIHFLEILNCNKGIYFTGVSAGAENKWYGGAIQVCTVGIDFAEVSPGWMEGNHFIAQIFGCDGGINLLVTSECSYTLFQGVIDNAAVVGSYDIYDTRSQNVFLMYFVRPTAITLAKESVLINGRLGGCKFASVECGDALTGAYSGTYIGQGAIEMWGTPYIDLKADYADDYAARIQLDVATGDLLLKQSATTTFNLRDSGDFKIYTAGKGVVLTNAAGTLARRVRLNDAGDGIIIEAV